MAFAATVIGALRRFLPDFLREHPLGDRARRRAVWALTHCRTATMGGHVVLGKKRFRLRVILTTRCVSRIDSLR